MPARRKASSRAKGEPAKKKGKDDTNTIETAAMDEGIASHGGETQQPQTTDSLLSSSSPPPPPPPPPPLTKTSATIDVDIHKLYELCVGGSNDKQVSAARLDNVRKWENRGALQEVVWPYLMEHGRDDDHIDADADADTAQTGRRHAIDIKRHPHWFHACHLLVLLVSHHFVEGAFSDGSSSTSSFLGYLDPSLDGGLDQNDSSNNLSSVLHRILETLLYETDKNDVDLQTRIVYFLDVAVTRSCSQNDRLLHSILPHVSTLALWKFMPGRLRELQLKKSAGLRRKYEAMTTAATTAADESNRCDSDRPLWIVSNIAEVLDLLEGKTKYGSLVKIKADEASMEEQSTRTSEVPSKVFIYLQRSLELLIDLLSLASTRLFLVTYLDAIDFSVRSRLAIGNEFAVPENLRLLQYLLTRINGLLAFPIQNASHKSLTKVEMVSMHHGRATTLQKMAHRYFPDDLQSVIYAGVGLLCGDYATVQHSYLERAFVGFSDKNLTHLLYRLRLLPEDNDTLHSREYMLQILGYYLCIPPYPTDQLRAYPLYPTESVLWDLSIIPPSQNQLRSSQVLALPKLSSQYLSFQDYLLRNFELVRLESAYEIRADLVNVIKRIRPVLRQTNMDAYDEDIKLKTEFNGWSRMSLELADPGARIVEVRPPRLGQTTSSHVTVEFTVDLEPCGASIRREWNEIGEFDNLFLVCVDASKMSGKPAPLVKDYHLQHGAHKMYDTDDNERRVPDEEDGTFPDRFGVMLVRGCMVMSVRNEHGTILSDPNAEVPEKERNSTKRIFRVSMDTAQYAADSKGGAASDLYSHFNLVVRRHGRENNFKSVLETIRGLMEGAASIDRVIPSWLQSVLLGTADPASASYSSDTMKAYAMKTVGVNKPTDFLDFGDTFLDEMHLRNSFEGKTVIVDGRDEVSKDKNKARSNYKIRFSEDAVEAVSVPFPDNVAGNPVRFTPLQVESIRSGLSPGLTLCVGPPGTGKTDVACQIIASLYHSYPTQRTVIITHSNAALNDIFTKVMERGDVDERYLVRLGSGERDLETDSTHDFTKIGRVAYSLQRRHFLLEQVQRMSEALGISGKAQRAADGSPSYTCETAEYFRKLHVERRKKMFDEQVLTTGLNSNCDNVTDLFPFKNYFHMETVTTSQAKTLFKQMDEIFSELAEYRPYELLRSQRQRSDYLINKQARVVAMTCTHAAIARSNLIQLGFEYDNIVMEESGQMLEIESFVPMLLQKGSTDESVAGKSRLKRVCMFGDHNQLPPVVKNSSFCKYSNLDQSMFARLISLGVPYIQLDRQGRAREDIMRLYSWRYKGLGNLDHILNSPTYQRANPGLLYDFQAINVEDYEGRGESTPTPYFYQNLGEAEYVVAMFQYLVLIGYPAHKISILTTYNGQKDLINDIVNQRCGVDTPLAGARPKAVSTVDQYQGQQNDIILLSLVRTKSVGHLRDVRRLVVALSRARLGLYVFCRLHLFQQQHELKPAMEQFTAGNRSSKLQLVLGETYPNTQRMASSTASISCDGNNDVKANVFQVEDVSHLGAMVHSMQEQLITGSVQETETT